MVNKLSLVVLSVSCFIIYLMYDISKTNIQLQRDVQTLKNKETILRKRIKNQRKTTEAVCSYNDRQGVPIDIDCGESFIPQYATCVCTTMCLADYSLVYTNSTPEDCPRWSKFEINPKKEEEDEEEDE